MRRWTIYKKDGTEREVVWASGEATGGASVAASDGARTPVSQWTYPELEYSGTWMGETFVTLNVRCAVPVDWQMGDYIIYRGERFVMNYDPSVVKKARRGTYGEGFTYDNVKFNSLGYELTDVRMLDYVLYDNQIHYTSLPRFDFFCATVDDLCDRLQANTNRWCAENGYLETDYWVFITPSADRSTERCEDKQDLRDLVTRAHSTYYGEDTDNPDAKTDQSISVDNMSVWDCLRYIKETFGYNFIIRGRMVIVGSMSILTPWVFEYGKGNGLYEIERTADDSQAVITKLFAYGSDKNLPTRYYAEIDSKAYAVVSEITEQRSGDIPYADYIVSLPNSTDYLTRPTEIISGVTWYEVVIRCDSAQAKGYFDFSDGRMYLHVSASYGNTKAVVDAFKAVASVGAKIYFLEGVNKAKLDGGNIEYDSGILPNNMSISRLMLPGFPKQSLYEWVKANGGTDCTDATGKATWRGYTAYFSKDKYKPYVMSVNADVIGVREGTKYFDGSDGTKEIYPTIEGAEEGGVHLDELVAADMVTDNGVYADGTEVQNINVTLPDLGSSFDLKELLQSDTVISMKNGYCGGRDFSVKSVTRDGSGWVCNIERDHDDALNLWFPYSHHVSTGGQAVADEPYQLRAGDKYVLTGIEMTSAYVELNAVRLLEETLKFLAANDYVRYTYAPKIDEIFMARQHDIATESEGMISMHDTLKEGDLMQFQDSDLQFLGSVFIDTLHIKEYGNGQIPTYEVTLRNDKAVGTIERMQQQIDSLSTGGGTVGGGGGINVTQTRQLIESYGKQLFLSKRENDVAKGRIDFKQGLTSGTYIKDASGAMINSLGDAEFREIRGREALIVPEVRFELAKGVVGVETQCSCGGQINEVYPDQNQQGEQQPTGGATLMLEDGEIGRLEVGDLCMGVWHRKGGGNAEDTNDDRKGNFSYQGFSTIYFRITDIPATDNEGNENEDRHYFEYELRPMTTIEQQAMLDRGEITAEELLAVAGGNGIHPYPLMHFYGRGNSEINEQTGKPVYPERQKFTLRTPEYTARLTEVSNWYFGVPNYTYVNGNLTGFEALLSELGPNPFGNKEKFGTIDCSLWMKGTIVQLPNANDFFMIAQQKLGLLRENESELVSFKVLDTYRNNKTAAYNYKVYRGETQLQKTITVSQDELNATFSLNYSDLDGHDSAEFTIRGTEKPPYQGSTAKVIEESFLVMKNAAERGQDADFFYILPSAYEVHVKKNGEIVPATQTRTVRVTFNCYKRGTNSDELISSNIYWTGGSTSPTSSPYYADINTENTTSVTIKAYSMVLDEQTHTPAPGVFLAAISIPVIRDGSDGVNAVVADFDDEMHSVACNADGTPMTSGSWTTTAQLWLGNTAQELKSQSGEEKGVEIVSKPDGVPASSIVATRLSDTVAQLTVNNNVFNYISDDSFVVKVQLMSVNSDSAIATATVVRIKAGENGDDGTATTYNIITEPTVISVDKNGNAAVERDTNTNNYYIRAWWIETVNNSQVSDYDWDKTGGGVSAYAFLEGGNASVVVSGRKIYVRHSSYDDPAAYYPLNLELRKYYGSQLTVLDKERIPVVRDGSDGISGTSTSLQYSSNKTSWHDGYSANDIWARTVYTDANGDEDYGTPFRIVGEKGNGGDYVDYKFAISAYDVNGTEGDTTTPPSDCTSSSVWQDAPMAATEEKPYLWMKRTPMDGATEQQKANTNITYVRVNGKDGADGVSSYTWIRYSEDGSTFARRGDVSGNILKDALFEADGKQDGTVIGTTGAFQKWFRGGTGSIVVRTSETQAVDNLRRLRVTAASGTYNNCDLKQAMNTLKPSTWYTLRFQARSVDYFITYITQCVDTTQRVIVDGREVNVGGDMAIGYYPRYEYVAHTISFKTKAELDTSTVGVAPTLYFRTFRTGVNISAAIIGSVTTNNSSDGALDIVAPVITEGKHDFTGENLLADTKELVGNTRTVVVNSEATRTVEDNATVLTLSSTVSTATSQYKNIVEFEVWHIAFLSDYVLSFDAKGSGQLSTYFYPTNVTSVENSDGYTRTWSSAGDGANSVALTNQWKRYWVRWRTSDANTANGIKRVLFRVQNGAVNTASIRLPKLELGSVATPWSPSVSEQQFGTAEGAWMGTLVWEHPYPSSNFGDYTWAKIKGDNGQKGEKGAKVRTRAWAIRDHDNPLAGIDYYKGDNGEEFADVVYYKNLAYQCIKSYNTNEYGLSDPPTPDVDTEHWQLMNNFENIATKLLVAENGWVKSLSVQSLLAYDEDTRRQTEIVADKFSITSTDAQGRDLGGIQIGLDTNGSPVIILSDNQGVFATLNRAFFKNSEAMGNTYTPIKLWRIKDSNGNYVTDVNNVDFSMVKKVASSGCTQYYIFHEGFTMVNGIPTAYNISRSNSPSSVDGKYLKDTALSATLTEANYTQHTIPYGSPRALYVKANDGNLVGQLLNSGKKRYVFTIYAFTSNNGKATEYAKSFEVDANDTMDGYDTGRG